MMIEIVFILILYVSCKFNIYFDISFINFIICICFLLISSYIVFKRDKSLKLYIKIISILFYIIIILMLLLICFHWFIDSSIVTEKTYKETLNNNNEILKVISYDDGGQSGPTYVVYQRKLYFGLICENTVKVNSSFDANFNLNEIYNELKNDNSFCKYNSRVFK